jgi:hypothetical protein
MTAFGPALISDGSGPWFKLANIIIASGFCTGQTASIAVSATGSFSREPGKSSVVKIISRPMTIAFSQLRRK